MTQDPTGSKSFLRRELSPHTVALFITLLVLGGILVVRHLGWFQFLEFQAYDFLLRQQPKAASSDPIVLVEMTEADIQNPSLDYPIHDDKLAELLAKLEAGKPSVIGLDIWRDLPVPKQGAGLKKLNEAFEQFTNIIAIFTLGGISPPAVLKGRSDRVAFNDNFMADEGVEHTTPKTRRSMLFLAEENRDSYDAFPYSIATYYLARRGISPQPEPGDATGIRLGKTVLKPFRGNEGAYVDADAGGWQMLLDFRCPTNFTRLTFSEVLEGKVPEVTLRDKIVLVGMNAPSVSDERVTPLDRRHRGIELQAGTVNQLLRHALEGEEPMRFWSDLAEGGWILLWCAMGGAMGYWVRSPWLFAPVALACAACLAGVVWLAFAAGLWIPAIAPVAAFVPAATLVTSYISFHEKKERGQLMQLFSKQVSPDIAKALWDQRHEFLAGQRPRTQKLTATVLFTDLEGFSTTSEKLAPDLLMDWLNEYMETMATAIMSHQGVIEKYIGDAIMACFGVPLARTSPEELATDARNAIRCALDMGRRMETLNADWQRRDLPVCGMRIGIHTGPLVAGSLGSNERQEYTVLGDSVNTASRLESFDKDWVDPDSPDSLCRILVSEATLDLVRGEFETVRVGTMILKNKNEPVTIYCVRSEVKV